VTEQIEANTASSWFHYTHLETNSNHSEWIKLVQFCVDGNETPGPIARGFAG
jgi:hypothetical protein